MRSSSIFLLLAMTGALTACSTTDEALPSPYSLKEFTNVKPVSRDATTALMVTERGGAAVREGGFEHVVAKREYANTSGSTQSFTPTTSPAEALKRAKVRSYSIYELSRWERFCGLDGRKMDYRDWEFISQEGTESVPLHMIGDCKPKSYTREEYLNAWRNSCNQGSAQAKDLRIQHETLKPPGICESRS